MRHSTKQADVVGTNYLHCSGTPLGCKVVGKMDGGAKSQGTKVGSSDMACYRRYKVVSLGGERALWLPEKKRHALSLNENSLEISSQFFTFVLMEI